MINETLTQATVSGKKIGSLSTANTNKLFKAAFTNYCLAAGLMSISSTSKIKVEPGGIS